MLRLGTLLVSIACLAAACGSLTESGPLDGIGDPCDKSSDCVKGLECHEDTFAYAMHRQCTAPCSSHRDCSTQFGGDAYCLGGGVCAAQCTADADCPQLSVCNDIGWCQRTGPGSGNPYCGGTPTPCEVLTFDECSSLGCDRVDGECTGVPLYPRCADTSFLSMCDRTHGCVLVEGDRAPVGD